LYQLAGAERNLFEIVTRINKREIRPVVFSLISGRLINVLNERGILAKDFENKKDIRAKGVNRSGKIDKILKRKM